MANDPANMIDPTGMWSQSSGYDGGLSEDNPSHTFEGNGDGYEQDYATFTTVTNDKGEVIETTAEYTNEKLEDNKAQGKSSVGLSLTALAAAHESGAAGIGLSITGVSIISTLGVAALTIGLVAIPSNWNSPRNPNEIDFDQNVLGKHTLEKFLGADGLKTFSIMAANADAILRYLGTQNSRPAQLYSINASVGGMYDVYEWGRQGPAYKAPAKPGEVLKYGTTNKQNVFGNKGVDARYSRNEWSTNGDRVYPVTMYRGNDAQVKFLEKMYTIQFILQNIGLPYYQKAIK